MISERPIIFSGPMVRAILAGTKTQTRRVVRGMVPIPLADAAKRCPYWADRLWVRETFANIAIKGYLPTYFYRADGDDLPPFNLRATDNRWRPSIHMPRAAARLFLRVTAVRCEQLQEISSEDAIAEGAPKRHELDHPRVAFKELWGTINAKRAPWASNPWVWVIEFERINA